MNKTQDALIALSIAFTLYLSFSLQIHADDLSHTARLVILSNTTATASNFGKLISASVTQLGETLTPVIARVHSVEPFTIEFLADPKQKDEIHDNPRPFVEGIKYAADDLKGLHTGDVISAHIYSYVYGDIELAIGIGIKNIKKLTSASRARYEKKGALLFYAPLRNSPNSYLTIYRNGTVLCHDMPGNNISNKHLTKAELSALKGEYFAKQIDQIPSDAGINGYGPRILLAIDHYQKLDIKDPPARIKTFLVRLNSMIESYIQSAIYRIKYIRRVAIKDWQYRDILPLDLAADEIGRAYLHQNMDKLSRIKPSPAFFKEAEDYERGRGDFYRYKGKIYSFTFPICTDRSTGSWACYRAAELPYGKLRDDYWGYTDWSSELGVRLIAVPNEGLDISNEEYSKHREFYTSLLLGSRFRYKEGDYLFLGVQVNYH